jgi:hypothetical protein
MMVVVLNMNADFTCGTDTISCKVRVRGWCKKVVDGWWRWWTWWWWWYCCSCSVEAMQINSDDRYQIWMIEPHDLLTLAFTIHCHKKEPDCSNTQQGVVIRQQYSPTSTTQHYYWMTDLKFEWQWQSLMICLLLHSQSNATKRNQIAQILNKEWSLAWGNHGCVWLTAAVLPQPAWHYYWMADLKFEWQSLMICLLLHSQSNVCMISPVRWLLPVADAQCGLWCSRCTYKRGVGAL